MCAEFGGGMRAVRLVLCGFVSVALMMLGLVPASFAAGPSPTASRATDPKVSPPAALPKVKAPQSVLPVANRETAASAPWLMSSRVASDVVVTNPSDWTVSLAMVVDTEVHRTATVNKTLTGSGMTVEIHSLTDSPWSRPASATAIRLTRLSGR
ncbi:hypothetical protein ABIE18_003646 [Arthrobacter sp. 2762]